MFVCERQVQGVIHPPSVKAWPKVCVCWGLSHDGTGLAVESGRWRGDIQQSCVSGLYFRVCRFACIWHSKQNLELLNLYTNSGLNPGNQKWIRFCTALFICTMDHLKLEPFYDLTRYYFSSVCYIKEVKRFHCADFFTISFYYQITYLYCSGI